MKYDFDQVVERRGTGSLKWDVGESLIEWGFADRFDKETVPLFLADMDIPVPPCVVKAMHKVADQQIYGYTAATPEYFDSIVKWFKRRHDWDIAPESITYCPGTVHALGVAIRAFTEPGDGIIIQRPVYAPFTKTIERLNRVVANNQMIADEKGRYSIDLEDFETQARKPENKLFILCNPQNPTGSIFRDEELKSMAGICKENGVIIIADEIHGDLIRQDAVFKPLVKAAGESDHIITCTAINKTFNVAGLHASNIVITNPMLRSKFREFLGVSLPTPFTLNAVMAAYSEGEDWLEQIKTYFDGNINCVLSFLAEKMPKVNVFRPEGTYLLWLDFRGYGLRVAELRKKIYTDANVLLESGKMFDPDQGEGFERVCLSSPRPIIRKAFNRIAAEFEGL